MTLSRWPLVALAAIAVATGSLSAGDLYPEKDPVKVPTAKMPTADELKSLAVNPAKVKLKGLDDAQQLIFTATLKAGGLQDLTHDAKYSVDNPKIARVTTNGATETIPLGPTHWARGLQAPAPFAFQRPTEASAMGGGVWQDNFDGTFTQLDDDYYVPATGYSYLDL